MRAFFVSCLVNNTSATTGSVLEPLTQTVHGVWSRGRLLSGQVLEDVLEYARTAEILHRLKPAVAQLDASKKKGFAGKPVANGESKRVTHRPIFGLLAQENGYP